MSNVVLSEILKDIDYTLLAGSLDTVISSIEENSSKVSEGTMFVAVKGNTNDAHRFIPDAVSKGAKALLVNRERTLFTDDELFSITKENGTTVVAVDNTREALALVISAFYDHPETKLNLIGVTGTKGKTTTTFMLHEILRAANQVPGLIGTVCNIVKDERKDANHTTPVALELYNLLSRMVESSAKSCVMEVSSLGVKQNRVSGLEFKVGCFTNFFRDHISPEEHPTMEDYLMSKLHMFDHVENAVVNIDSNEAATILDYCNKTSRVVTYGLSDNADVRAVNITKKTFKGAVGTSFELKSPWYSGEVFVALPGVFNVYNALCAITVSGVLGIPFETIKEGLISVRVPGRVEPVTNNLGISVLVDYAHNGESLKSVLEALREYTEGKLISVFGCGGNRSSDRRIGMGQASGEYADFTIITTDNPRDEEPMAIIEQIVEGIEPTKGEYEIVPDRTDAIEYAIRIAKPGDLVLIAGKGHENYQIIKGVKSHYDDREVAAKAISDLEEN